MKTLFPSFLRRARAPLTATLVAAGLLSSGACLASLSPAALKTEADESLPAANIAARETLVLQQLQAIKRGQDFFNMAKNRYGTIEELVAAGHINRPPDGLGYRVSLTLSDGGTGYVLTAVPQTYGPNGQRSFYLDQSGVTRGADRKGAPATASDPIAQ
jgi:hypothetical protein